MIHLLIIPFLFFGNSLISYAQQDSVLTDSSTVFTLESTIPVYAKDIETDRLGNVFIVNNTNQLTKYNKSGKLLSTLNYNYQGSISYVDPTNPMEVYVFYKELNKTIYLDNNLAYRGEADLTALSIGMASTIARSYDNGLWVFDLIDLQLKKMTKDGQDLQFSGNIRQYVTNEKVNPTEIYDNGSRVFLNDSLSGILVFDVFCSYIKTIPVKGCNHIKVIEDNLYYFKANKLYRYNLKTFRQSAFNLPVNSDIKDISIEKDHIYILRTDQVLIYRYQ